MVNQVPAIGFLAKNVRGPVLEVDRFPINHVVIAMFNAGRVAKLGSFNHGNICHHNLTLKVPLRHVLKDVSDSGAAVSKFAEGPTV